MFLFKHLTQVSPAYLAERLTMQHWIVGVCGCGAGRANQVMTDIENHNGTLAKAVALGVHRTAVTYQFLWMAPGFIFARTNAGVVPTAGATINPF